MMKGYGPLMEISRGFWRSSVLFAGVKLGIFDHLEGKGNDLGSIVAEMGIDRRGAQILLNALAALGIIEKEGEVYRNNRLSSTFLARSSPNYKGNVLMHSADMWKAWGDLENVVKTGKPAETYEEKFLHDERRRVRNFIFGMDQMAEDLAELLAGSRAVARASKMLDIGGGPGTYCRYFIRKNPKIRATILDLPLTLEITKELIRAHHMEERISTIEGDLLEADFGTGYDLILISQVLHSFSHDQNRKLIERSFRALVPGGSIMINEFALDEDMISPPEAALFAVNMLVNTEGGATYTIKEISGWLREAGFKNISARRILERVTNFTARR